MHSETLEASSVFNAADQAIQRWARLWWFDADSVLLVQSSEERWTVKQESVRKWRAIQEARNVRINLRHKR